MDHSWKARQKAQRKGKQKKEKTESTDIPDVGRSGLLSPYEGHKKRPY